MAWCPFAVHKPLSENHTQGSITPRAIVLHTAVSGADSLFDFFQRNSDLESHFYVRESGVIEQYMDTRIRADANKNANDFAVSIESEDGGVIKAWTPAAVNSLVKLCDWLCQTHPTIPRRRIPSAYSSGIGWHVQFGAPGPWTPVSKSCPGGPRIEQTKNVIIPRVVAGNVEDVMDAHQYAVLVETQRRVTLTKAAVEQIKLLVDQAEALATAARDESTNAKVAANAANGKADAALTKLDNLTAKVDGISLGTVNVDIDALCAQLAPVVTQLLANELDRRARDGDPATGPVS